MIKLIHINLTASQMNILDLMARGFSVAQISIHTDMSTATIERLIFSVEEKAKAESGRTS